MCSTAARVLQLVKHVASQNTMTSLAACIKATAALCMETRQWSNTCMQALQQERRSKEHGRQVYISAVIDPLARVSAAPLPHPPFQESVDCRF